MAEMTSGEWESLCDGCGKCCLLKSEDEDSGEIHFTDVSCEQLNIESCRCKNYAKRFVLVPDCLSLQPDNILQITSLPQSCAYRLLALGESLPDWHPLVSGDSDSVHKSGHSVRGRVMSEQYIHPSDIDRRIIQWVQ